MKTAPTKPERTDRRVRKTKKLLSNALSSLIIEKGYDAVSVKDILDRAKVGRSTFYAHFEDKEQLLFWGHDTFERLLKESVIRPAQGPARTDIDFLFLYRHIHDNRALIGALMESETAGLVGEQLQSILSFRIAGYFREVGSNAKEPQLFSMKVQAAAAAVVSLLKQWIQQGMPLGPEEMERLSEELLRKIMA